MSKLHMPMTVEMEDGSTWEVVADQRDAAQWELQPFGCPFFAGATKGLALMRWMAWHAGKRHKRHNLTWDKFSELCVAVSEVPPTEGTDAEDPGQRAASVTPS